MTDNCDSHAKHLLNCRVESLAQVAFNTYRLTFASNWLAEQAQPGQFVNIAVPRCGDILWRRPFSFHQIDRHSGACTVLIQVIGRGSEALTRVQPGEHLSCLAPLGNHFVIPAEIDELLIVAGGLGIAPFFFLLQEVAAQPYKKVLFYGAASADCFCRVDELSSLTSQLFLTTDDGSRGEQGLVIKPLQRFLAEPDSKRRLVLTCGPTRMMQAVQNLCKKYHLPGYVSVENLMACGFGACMGCAVQMIDKGLSAKPFLLACKDGPVFPIDEIVIDE
ncbi:MAG TPA: dihydroorotate dehydrogenase electron transfer subunit [bacterium]|nr:dihydroorotate dehydrogenase electron transfer subunit [bacterium]